MTYDEYIATLGPAGDGPDYWAKMEETSGTVMTNSGNGADGTHHASTVLGDPKLTPGVGAYSARYTETANGYSYFPSLSNIDWSFTLSAWVNVDPTSTDDFGILAQGDHGSASHAGWVFGYVPASNVLRFSVYTASGWTTVDDPIDLEAAGTTHVGMKINCTSGYARFYVNGAFTSQGALPVGLRPYGSYYADPITIGGRDYNATSVYITKGKIDEAMYIAGEISDDEMANIYSGSITGVVNGVGGMGGLYQNLLRRRRRG